MRILLTTNVRDEKHIVEWVTHHILVGFTHIFINDHRSVRPVKDVLHEAGVPSHRYTVRRLNTPTVTKHVLMQEMYTYALRSGYNWTINLDGDEFLKLPPGQLVSDFLGRYLDCDQVSLNWLLFGTSYLLDHPHGQSLMETYLKCQPTFHSSVKSFIQLNHRPLRVTNYHPHVYYLTDMSRSRTVLRQPLNKTHPFSNPVNIPIAKMPAYIAHYFFMAYNDYVQRKVKLPRDDKPCHRQLVPRPQLDSLYNDAVNEQIRDEYDDRVKRTGAIWKANKL